MAKNNSPFIFLFILLGIASNCHTADQPFYVEKLPELGFGILAAMGGGHFYHTHTTKKTLAAQLDKQIKETQEHVTAAQTALSKEIEQLATRVTEQFSTHTTHLNATEARLNAEIKAATTSILAEAHAQESRLKEAVNTSGQGIRGTLATLKADAETQQNALLAEIKAVSAHILSVSTAQEGRLIETANISHQATSQTLTAMETRLGQKITDFAVLIQQSAGDVKTVKDLAEKQEKNETGFLKALQDIKAADDVRYKALEENYSNQLVAHLRSGVLLALVASSNSKVTGRTLSEYLETALAYGLTNECKGILGKHSMAPLLPALAENLRGFVADSTTSDTLLDELREGKTKFSAIDSQRKSEEARRALLNKAKSTTTAEEDKN